MFIDFILIETQISDQIIFYKISHDISVHGRVSRYHRRSSCFNMDYLGVLYAFKANFETAKFSYRIENIIRGARGKFRLASLRLCHTS